jgi:hypothetical protein
MGLILVVVVDGGGGGDDDDDKSIAQPSNMYSVLTQNKYTENYK